MKKALFIDRDGTVIAEPPADYQVDSLEKLEFIPGAISALRTLRGLDFELVMATNQDGLGTEAFPEEDFRPPHEKMLRTLAGEGVAFDDMLIDRTFESDDAPTRKPRTGMFGRYTDGSYDLGTSYVVGDRATDILLARNLGAKGILLAPAAEGRRMLREAGAEVLGIVSIFTYGMQKSIDRLADAKVKNISLTDFDTVVHVAAEKNIIKPGDIARLIAFRNNPSDISWINGGNN